MTTVPHQSSYPGFAAGVRFQRRSLSLVQAFYAPVDHTHAFQDALDIISLSVTHAHD